MELKKLLEALNSAQAIQSSSEISDAKEIQLVRDVLNEASSIPALACSSLNLPRIPVSHCNKTRDEGSIF
jgi:hypothetical protein